MITLRLRHDKYSNVELNIYYTELLYVVVTPKSKRLPYNLVVEYGYVPVIRVRYGTYQKIKCAVPACRTMDVPANLTVTSCY